MEEPTQANGASSPVVHLLPEVPKNAGPLDSCVEVKANEPYILDGRIKQLKFGCSWSASEIDVDAALAIYSGNMKCVDVLWWDKPVSYYVSARHLNDDRIGEAPPGRANEEMLVNLEEVPPSVHHMVVVLTVYSKGKTLGEVRDISLKLMNTKGETDESNDLLEFTGVQFNTSAAIMGVLSRQGSWWNFTALGETASGRTVKEVVYSMTLDQIIMEPSVTSQKYRLFAWAEEGQELAASDRPFYGPRSSDCFVEIKFKKTRGVSEVIHKSLDPKWEMDKLDLGSSTDSDYGVVEFNVWDHDTNSPDDFLGCALVAVGGVCQKGEGTHKLQLTLGPSRDENLKPKDGVEISGCIKVCFEVVPEAK